MHGETTGTISIRYAESDFTAHFHCDQGVLTVTEPSLGQKRAELGVVPLEALARLLLFDLLQEDRRREER